MIIECVERGYTLLQIPRGSGCRGRGVGVLLNTNILFRLVVIHRIPLSKENNIKRSSFITEFTDYRSLLV